MSNKRGKRQAAEERNGKKDSLWKQIQILGSSGWADPVCSAGCNHTNSKLNFLLDSLVLYKEKTGF